MSDAYPGNVKIYNAMKAGLNKWWTYYIDDLGFDSTVIGRLNHALDNAAAAMLDALVLLGATYPGGTAFVGAVEGSLPAAYVTCVSKPFGLDRVTPRAQSLFSLNSALNPLGDAMEFPGELALEAALVSTIIYLGKRWLELQYGAGNLANSFETSGVHADINADVHNALVAA